MNATEPSLLNALNAITEIHEIRGPVGIPGEWLWLWVVLTVVLLVVTAAVFLFFVTKRRKVSVIAAKPAWELALEALMNIERAGYIQKDQFKEYYSELSGVVRWYIEQRLDVRAPEMTTEEFIHAVRFSERLTQTQQGFLRDFLNASDMVKFAQFVPTA